MGGRVMALAAAAMLAACGEDAVRIRVDALPDSAQSVALVFEKQGTFVSSTGLIPTSYGPISQHEIELAASDRVRLFAYGAMEDVELSDDPADNPPVRPAGAEDLQLAPVVFYAEGSFENGFADLRTETTPLYPLTFDGLPACNSDPCDALPLAAIRPVDVLDIEGPEGFVNFLLPLDQTRTKALASIGAGLWVIDSAGAERLATTSTETAYHAGLLAEDDTLWLLDQQQWLFRGRPEASLERLAQNPCPEERTSLVGPTSGPVDELFTVGFSGCFARWNGTDWERLHQFPLDGAGSTSFDLIWLGPGRAAALFANANQIALYDNGELFLANDVPQPLAVARDTRGEIFLVSSNQNNVDAAYYHLEGHDWIEVAPLADSGGNTTPLMFAAGDGLMHGGSAGVLSFLHPSLGSCAARTFAPFTIRFAVSLQAGVLVLDKAVIDQRIEGGWLEHVLPDRRPCVPISKSE